MNSLNSPARSPQLPLEDPATERAAARLGGREEDMLYYERYQEGRRSVCLYRKVIRLICSSGRGSPRVVRRITHFATSLFLWILLFFLGTSSGTCSSSSHSRFTTTGLSGSGNQLSLVTVNKYLISGSSTRTDNPRMTAEDAEGLG